MEILTNIIQTTLESFDFAFCVIVNILTYCVIKVITDSFHKKLTRWQKRAILIAVIFSTGVIHLVIGSGVKLVLNSAILAPVFWTWIMKPLCSKLGIDYKPII